MPDPHDPGRSDAPPRYAAAPYISPFEQRGPRPDGAADVASHGDVVSGLVIDVVLVVAAITLLAPRQDPALYALGWLVVRYLPLAVAATSPGGLIAGIRVRGPEFGWANPVRILIRELTMPLALLAWLIMTAVSWDAESLSGDSESRSLVDGRLIPDFLAGTWTVDVR